MRSLTEFRVLTFDCYGTLIDWESGIWDSLQPLIIENARVDVTRARALSAFAELESRHEQAAPTLPYPAILARVHRSIADRFGLRSNAALDGAFGDSVPEWPAFPDTADALRSLKKRYRLVILSNVHREGIAGSNRKLGVDFDAIYTADAIGAYKPADRNFAYLLDHLKLELGMNRSDVLHTAQSLYHDHAPANRFRLANAWIDRQRLSGGGGWGATERVETMPTTDFVFYSLGEMAEAANAAF